MRWHSAATLRYALRVHFALRLNVDSDVVPEVNSIRNQDSPCYN